MYLWGAYQIAVDGREPGCMRGIVDGPISARLIRQVMSLFERDEKLGQCLIQPSRLRQRLPERILYEKGFKLKPFWQWILLHSMFFTSNI